MSLADNIDDPEQIEEQNYSTSGFQTNVYFGFVHLCVQALHRCTSA